MSFEKLSKLIEDVRPTLTKAGLDEAEVISVLDYRVDHAAALGLVARIVDGEVAAWRTVRAKVTEGMWDYYEATGESKLIECRQLREVSRNLRKAWRERVLPFWKEAKKRAKGNKDGNAPHDVDAASVVGQVLDGGDDEQQP